MERRDQQQCVALLDWYHVYEQSFTIFWVQAPVHRKLVPARLPSLRAVRETRSPTEDPRPTPSQTDVWAKVAELVW